MEYDYYMTPLLALVCIVGLLTNGALLCILAKTNVATTPNALILNLAVADLVVLLFHLPLVAASQHVRSFPYGALLCKTSSTAYWIGAGVSAFTLIAMSVHSLGDGRHAATTTPSNSRGKRIRVVAVIWTLAVGMSVSTMLCAHVFESHDGDQTTSYCVPSDQEIQRVEFVARFVAYIAIPLVAIAYAIWRQKRIAGVQNRARKDFNVVLCLFAVYVFSFVPFYAVYLRIIFQANDYNRLMNVIATVVSFMTFAYRCLNPVALFWASGAFRQLFSQHFLCCCTSKTREPVTALEQS